MKTRFACILCVAILSGCTGNAQTPATNTWPMPAGKKAVLKLPYARNITVKAWTKAELQFNTTIQTTKEETKKIHTVDIQDDNAQLSITTDFRKDINWKNVSCCWCDQCDTLLQPGVVLSGKEQCLCFRVDYEIMLPSGAAISLETISGDIEIKGLNGAVRAKTISGFVDLDRKASAAANLDFRSVTGEIYTDFDIKLDEKSTSYSKKVRTGLNGGGSDVVAETVSGDIFFRKQ